MPTARKLGAQEREQPGTTRPSGKASTNELAQTIEGLRSEVVRFGVQMENWMLQSDRESSLRFEELRTWLQALAAAGGTRDASQGERDRDTAELARSKTNAISRASPSALEPTLASALSKFKSSRRNSNLALSKERRKYTEAKILAGTDVGRRLNIVETQKRPRLQMTRHRAEKGPWYISHPHSLFHGIWDIAMAAILLMTFVLIPFSFFCEIAESLLVLNNVIDVRPQGLLTLRPLTSRIFVFQLGPSRTIGLE